MFIFDFYWFISLVILFFDFFCFISVDARTLHYFIVIAESQLSFGHAITPSITIFGKAIVRVHTNEFSSIKNELNIEHTSHFFSFIDQFPNWSFTRFFFLVRWFYMFLFFLLLRFTQLHSMIAFYWVRTRKIWNHVKNYDILDCELGQYKRRIHCMDTFVYLNLKNSKLTMKILVSNVRAQIPHDCNAIIFLTTKQRIRQMMKIVVEMIQRKTGSQFLTLTTIATTKINNKMI